MPASSRSVPTGPGSRGGRPIDAAYHRDWRTAHPDYVRRDNARRRRSKQRLADARDVDRPTVTATIRLILRRWCEVRSFREVGVTFGLDHTTVMRLVVEDRMPSGDTIDAVVAVIGLEGLVAEHRRHVRAWREASR